MPHQALNTVAALSVTESSWDGKVLGDLIPKFDLRPHTQSTTGYPSTNSRSACYGTTCRVCHFTEERGHAPSSCKGHISSFAVSTSELVLGIEYISLFCPLSRCDGVQNRNRSHKSPRVLICHRPFNTFAQLQPIRAGNSPRKRDCY